MRSFADLPLAIGSRIFDIVVLLDKDSPPLATVTGFAVRLQYSCICKAIQLFVDQPGPQGFSFFGSTAASVRRVRGLRSSERCRRFMSIASHLELQLDMPHIMTRALCTDTAIQELLQIVEGFRPTALTAELHIDSASWHCLSQALRGVQLTNLSLSDVTVAGLHAFLTNQAQHLRCLNFSYAHDFGMSGFDQLDFPNLPALRDLTVHCDTHERKHYRNMAQLLQKTPALRKLCMRDDTMLAVSPEHFPTPCFSSLESLSLMCEFRDYQTPTMLANTKDLLKQCDQLRYLELRLLPLWMIPLMPSTLQVLKLSCCSKQSGEALRDYLYSSASNMPRLHSVRISYSGGPGRAVRAALVAACQNRGGTAESCQHDPKQQDAYEWRENLFSFNDVMY